MGYKHSWFYKISIYPQETFSELQNVLISVNKADIMDCSVSEKIKQAEVLKKVNVPSSVLGKKWFTLVFKTILLKLLYISLLWWCKL